MSPTHPSTTRPRRRSRRGFTLIELLTVITVIGILAAILVPAVNGAISAARRAKSQALLNNLVQSAMMYNTEYKYYPTLTTGTPGADFKLSLKENGTTFINVMSGQPANDTEKRYNRNGTPFLTLSDDQLSPDGTMILDSFGNDDIVIIMDTDRNGQIASVNQPLLASSGKTITVIQNSPVFDKVIALSPGKGLTPDDAVTTWTVKQ